MTANMGQSLVFGDEEWGPLDDESVHSDDDQSASRQDVIAASQMSDIEEVRLYVLL